MESSKRDEVIRPILRGRDIQKYTCNWANLYLINTHTGYRNQNGDIVPPLDLKKYPSIKEHLDKYYIQLTNRQDKGITPYHLRSCIYTEDFFKPKIVWGEISDRSKFSFDSKNFYCEATTFLLTGNNLKYLLAMLNSKLLEWYFNQIGTATGIGTNRWKKYTIELLPIKIPTSDTIAKVEKYVDLIINKNDIDGNVSDIINGIVYEQYNLNGEEIEFIESINI